MAALIKHGLSKNKEININLLFKKSLSISCCCYVNKKYKQKLKKVEVLQCRKLKSTEDSISSRGFLRAQKSYDPPPNVEEKLELMFSEIISNGHKKESFDPSNKYSLLTACFREFKHSVPNSILHTIKNYNDLLDFYKTPVDTRLPLNKLKSSSVLPPNLHIQLEPLRFLGDEDTMFGGQTAFPKTNTLVTGLRARKKFRGHKDTEDWPVDIKDL